MRDEDELRVGMEAMFAYRAALDRAIDTTEVPIADFANTLMLVDTDALRKDPFLIPDAIMRRFSRRRFKVRRDIDAAELAALSYIEPWFRKQAIDSGYGVMTFPLSLSEPNERGRRQLTHTEKQIRDALRFWTYVLLPEIEKHLPILTEKDRRSLSIQPDQEVTIYDFLAGAAPNFAALSRRSAAGRKNQGDTGDPDDRCKHAELVTYTDALIDEGRKIRVRFPGEQNSRYGVSAREKAAEITKSFERSYGSPRHPDLRHLAFGRVGVIEQLAKASRIAETAMSEQRALTAVFEENMDRVEDVGVHHIVQNPNDHGKRDLAAASRVQRAQFHPTYVQSPNLEDQDRLTPADLAVIALLCDIDPYTICAQHMFLAEDIATIRDLGRALRGEPVCEPSRLRENITEMAALRRRLNAAKLSPENDIAQVAEISVVVPEMLLLGR
ncbi:hypothetical protein ACFOM8_20890 [Paracoccus angustae]|uniref:Uncharacterized protein n=1 Tax=Paracoccus angustae TaxID=1671480 RepID=A0ABV7UA97_9RHOB